MSEQNEPLSDETADESQNQDRPVDQEGTRSSRPSSEPESAPPAEEVESADGVDDLDPDVLQTRVRRLEEENRRLRDQYAGVRERRGRQTTVGLAVVGAVFGGAGFVVTSAQEVLFTIAATGLFAAVLTRYLTPERFIPLDIGEGTYTTLAGNEAALADQLGLSSTRVYLDTTRGPRLFIPEIEAYDSDLLDEDDQFTQPIIANDRAARSGLSLRPVAESLLQAFEEQHSGPLPSTPNETVSALREGVTDALELARHVEIDLDVDDGRATFSIGDPLYSDVTQFDHPISSFLGAGLARALGTPIEVDVITTEHNGRTTPLVTCRWDPDQVEVLETEENATEPVDS